MPVHTPSQRGLLQSSPVQLGLALFRTTVRTHILTLRLHTHVCTHVLYIDESNSDLSAYSSIMTVDGYMVCPAFRPCCGTQTQGSIGRRFHQRADLSLLAPGTTTTKTEAFYTLGVCIRGAHRMDTAQKSSTPCLYL